jgi:4-hydroxy-2-oxoheptanedioate aldolase
VKNPIKALWQANRTAINGWCNLSGSMTAEAMGRAGWDSVTIDLQHGVIDYMDAVTMIQAISLTPAVPLVRSPWNEPSVIMKLLDAGAMGIICPMVNNAEEAAAFVSNCRYAPKGRRSFGPVRAGMVHTDYWTHANDAILTIAMVETAEAMENLDGIMATPGLDAVYIGPSDLGLSLVGKPIPEPTDPTVLAAVAKILERACAHKIVAGFHNMTPEHARKMSDQGFRFVTIGGDLRFLSQTAASVVKAFGDR